MADRFWEISSERTRTLVILGVVAVMATLSLRYGLFATGGDSPGNIVLNGSSSHWPDRPVDAEDARLHEERPTSASKGGYAFIAKQSDQKAPVTYDPCAPIHLVVNPRSAPTDAERLVDAAVEQVEDATGLELVIDGETDEEPSKDREAQIDQYGDGWAPVLLAWSDPEETPSLEGDTAGFGGSRGASRDDHMWFVSGGLTLDGPQIDTIIDSPGGEDAARAVVMHELGHVVGLDHVKTPGELMQARGSVDRTDWGPGDLEGLAKVGSGPCIDY